MKNPTRTFLHSSVALVNHSNGYKKINGLKDFHWRLVANFHDPINTHLFHQLEIGNDHSKSQKVHT